MAARRLMAWAAAAALAAGCTFVTSFWDLEDNPPTVSFGTPSGYPRSNFGQVVAAGVAGSGDERSTYVAVSAGTGSPTELYHWARGTGIVSDKHLESVCSPLGGLVDPNDETLGTCDDSGTGAAVVWIPDYWWGPDHFEGCVVVGQPTAGDGGRVAVSCVAEDDTPAVGIGPAPDMQLGRSLGFVVSGGAQRVVVGSKGDADLTRSALTADHPETLSDTMDLAPLEVVAEFKNEGYGGAVAGGGTADGLGYVVVGAATAGLAPPPGPSRLVVFRPNDHDETETAPSRWPFLAAACLEDEAGSAFGSVLATGDVDADDDDELLVRGADGEVLVYDGGDISPLGIPEPPDRLETSECDFAEPTATLTCPTEELRDVVCSDQFGEVFAVGDVDGDGRGEILIGDPGANVSDTARAGAVHVFKFEGGSWQRLAVLADAVPQGGQLLGSAIALAPVAPAEGSGARVEPFVGAPGTNEVFVFYCTGLEDDKPGAEGLDGSCRPRAE